ncbi:protein kinase superfamily protein, partial [Tanacetum coccineum]
MPCHFIGGLIQAKSAKGFSGDTAAAHSEVVALTSESATNIRTVASFCHEEHILKRDKTFSTRFSSVHREKPSAEYAKLRKESLESEFGDALTSRSKRLSVYYSFGRFLALYRVAFISYEVFKLTVGQFFIHDLNERATK